MTTLDELSQLIAMQLNDHEAQQHGVEQESYYTYIYPHVLTALNECMGFLYAILPDEFTRLFCKEITEDTCLIDLNNDCEQVKGLFSVGSGCDNLYVVDDDKYDLMSIISSRCNASLDEIEDNKYGYRQLSKGIYQFNRRVEAGQKVYYTCSKFFKVEGATSEFLSKHRAILIPYALWLILLTDNESRSNLDRSQLYYKQVETYLQTRFSIDKSLVEREYYHRNNLLGNVAQQR